MMIKLAAGAARLLLAAGAAVALAVALLASPTVAHPNDKLPAKTLVEQSIALLRTQPNQVAAIGDKLHDALEASNSAGVDLALVRRADQAFERRDLHRARDLLEASIGAAPHRVVAQPNPKPRQPATTQPSTAPASPPATTAEVEAAAHELALDTGPQAPAGPGAAALLGLAGLLALAGVVIVRRVR